MSLKIGITGLRAVSINCRHQTSCLAYLLGILGLYKQPDSKVLDNPAHFYL